MLVTIEKLVHGGSGFGVDAEKKIFVPFSAPGDVLEVEIRQDHGNWAEAEIRSIVEPSPLRVEPACPVFGRCGGCQWQHISYEAQLVWKGAILVETLERIGKIRCPKVLAALPSPKQWHYRNRIQLHVDSKGRVGFYRPKSKEVVEFDECLIADEKINEELSARRGELARRDRGAAIRAECEEGFAQVNGEQNEQMRRTLASWISEVPHETVLELYAGSGNLTFAFAGLANRVVASDVDGRAIETAIAMQRQLGIHNVEFIRAPSGEAARCFPDGCDALVLDPPRKGCADAVGSVLALKPKSIFYISCDPATLARDLRAFMDNGYAFEKSLPIDMFPQTYHIESLTKITRA